MRLPWWVLSDAPYPGGAEQYLKWILDAAGPTRMGLVAVDKPGLRDWISERESVGFRVVRLPDEEWWRQLRQLWGFVGRERPSVLHVNQPGPYDGIRALAGWVARRAGVPRVIVTEHLPGVGRVGRRYWVKRLGVTAVDRAIAVCEAHRPLLENVFKYDEDQTVVILNGVPDPNPEGRISSGDRMPPPEGVEIESEATVRIIQVGALDQRKGGDIVLGALRGLLDRGLDAAVWFVGDGPQRNAWTRLRDRLDLASRVSFLGERSDVPSILSAGDVAVLASHREGLPLSLLEASAMGLPIVATDVDGMSEVVETDRTGIVVPAGDERRLEEALARLVVDPGLRHSFGRAARERYERKFKLSTMVDRTLLEYESRRSN